MFEGWALLTVENGNRCSGLAQCACYAESEAGCPPGHHSRSNQFQHGLESTKVHQTKQVVGWCPFEGFPLALLQARKPSAGQQNLSVTTRLIRVVQGSADRGEVIGRSDRHPQVAARQQAQQ